MAALSAHIYPSEWYHKKDAPIWLPFLNNLTKDAPEWKEYSEAYIEKMVWMQEAGKLKLGPLLWHMHPVMFLGTLKSSNKIIWMKKFFEKFGEDKTSAFRAKLLEVSNDLNIDPN
ncbi:hypothetical protein ABW286_22950 [Erwinia papayae]|uniref:Uncharacterized protein n=1 Tax=Erwinia papayae TaxID=206499 RepID=A0ABV3N839_9GAMM